MPQIKGFKMKRNFVASEDGLVEKKNKRIPHRRCTESHKNRTEVFLKNIKIKIGLAVPNSTLITEIWDEMLLYSPGISKAVDKEVSRRLKKLYSGQGGKR